MQQCHDRHVPTERQPLGIISPTLHHERAGKLPLPDVHFGWTRRTLHIPSYTTCIGSVRAIYQLVHQKSEMRLRFPGPRL